MQTNTDKLNGCDIAHKIALRVRVAAACPTYPDQVRLIEELQLDRSRITFESRADLTAGGILDEAEKHGFTVSRVEKALEDLGRAGTVDVPVTMKEVAHLRHALEREQGRAEDVRADLALLIESSKALLLGFTAVTGADLVDSFRRAVDTAEEALKRSRVGQESA